MVADTTTLDFLNQQFGEFEVSEFRGQTRVLVPAAQIHGVLKALHAERNFKMLADISCVDYLAWRDEMPGRFGLVYLLTNIDKNERITLRVFLDEPDLVVPSATDIWEGANWLEREVWDLFGIRFDGHPDHRRIVLPEGFASHPLRKDYPLQGRGERHNFPVVQRESS